MLTDATLRSKIDAVWDKLWSGGLPNPADVIEQLSFLFFLKRLDEKEQDNERAARLLGKKFEPIFTDKKLRWSHWTQLPADKALKQVKEKVFPFIKTIGGKAGPFAEYMANAEFKISKSGILIEVCRALDEMQISGQQQDVQGDLFEYVLSKLNTAGQNGQFRTPRHIIRMMVKMVNPQPGERVADPAAGTCGFLVNAWQHIQETHTDPRDLRYDEEGYDTMVPQAIVTANALISGIALSFIGGFDETFKQAAGEDLDLGLRLRRLGMIGWAEMAIVKHRFPEDREDFIRRFRRYGAGNRALEVKHNLPSLRARRITAEQPELQELADLQAEAMQKGYDDAVDENARGKIFIPQDTAATPGFAL